MDDNFEHGERFKHIIEHLSKEISDDVLQKIIKCQQKYPLQDCAGGSYSGTKNVATMTDKDVCCGGGGEKSISAKKPAEKPSTKTIVAEERKEMQKANKMYKPGECMKHITVELHPTLSSAWYVADVDREVTATGARVRVTSALCSPALVLWSRRVAATLSAESGLVQLAPAQEQCERALYVTTAEELSELVAAQGLAREMGQVVQLTGCKTTLVVFGVQEYFKPSGRRKASNHHQQMTEVQLEMALTDLLVSVGCDTVKVENPNDLALTIVHFTKAIAEAPYKKAKRQCDEQAQYYMRGDNKNCIAVNKNGVGAAKLWQQMLAILPMSSLERSRALCARYASPKQLFVELLDPGGVERVADIGVARSAVPGSQARRTGVEFARKLAILFTADDGDALVQ